MKKELSNKSFEEKVSSYSLPEDRADILEHAIAIFIEIIEFFPNSFLFDSSWNIADAVMEKELQENKNIQAAWIDFSSSTFISIKKVAPLGSFASTPTE